MRTFDTKVEKPISTSAVRKVGAPSRKAANVLTTNDVPPRGATNSTVSDRLALTQWHFHNALATRSSIHSFHSYPAKFIPEIPRALLQAIRPSKDTLIFDPFCGCGTTLLEAQRAGYASAGVDLNPVGCLLSRVKTSPLPPYFMATVDSCIAEALHQLGSLPLPDIPNLLHWFRKDVCDALASLRFSMNRVEDVLLRQAMEATFSSIVVRVSNQESDTRYAAITKNDLSPKKVFSYFREAAQTLSEQAVTLPSLLNAPAAVINKSIFDVEPSDIPGEVGLVVTSPPYPNAYEYWLYHKYRMWWLGYDPIKVKAQEIGARAHFFSGRRLKKENFYEQMSRVFELLIKIMRKGAYCCFIVGDSKVHGRIIDNAELLLRAASNFGFNLVFKVQRDINPHRKSFNLHHARIKHEHVLVWVR